MREIIYSMKSILALLFFFASFPALAQTDVRAKAILDALAKKAATYKTLQATFSANVPAPGGKGGTTQRGTFLMKGAKYRLTLPTQDTRCDGRTVWTFIKDANEVQVSTPDESSENGLSPIKLFTQFSDRNYKSRYIGDRTVGGKASQVVELLPTKSSQAFKKVELAVAKATGTPSGATVWDKSGAKYAYTIVSYTPNGAIADAQFVWNAKANPKVEVVDLR
jgi:outer membrane lipoprotein-sorting protein